MILVLYLENPKDTTRKLLELYWTVVRLVNREENSRKENRNLWEGEDCNFRQGDQEKPQ